VLRQNGRAAVLVGLLAALACAAASPARTTAPRVMRLELHLAPDARTRPHLLLMTLGGPIYCRQLLALARNVGASLACTDYGPNRYVARGGRAGRLEDWGDPAYLDAVAKVPARLRSEGVAIAKLALVGVSYSGYANAELVATHPEIGADALVVADSYLDLPARYRAIPPSHETRAEIEKVLGGTLANDPGIYAERSPSHHLAGLAAAIEAGMRLVVVWSVADSERREFHGATCSRFADAEWLSRLASILGNGVPGYVTRLPHAHALWDRGQALLGLAGVWSHGKPLVAKRVVFAPGSPPPAATYC
jgi:pimeloyl-ACP methyl ester carboxylesterase